MSSWPSSKNITGIKSNTLHSKLRMALKFHIKPIRLRQSLKLALVKTGDCDIPIKFVVIFGKWNKDDDNNYHILINPYYQQSTCLCQNGSYKLSAPFGYWTLFQGIKGHLLLWSLPGQTYQQDSYILDSLSCCMDSHLLDQTKLVLV